MCGDFTWRVSDCEELVGVTHTEEVKGSPVLTTATKVLFPNTISVRVFEVGEVLLDMNFDFPIINAGCGLWPISKF